MEVQLDQEMEEEILSQVRKYRLDHIEPKAEEDDEKKKFRMEIFQGFGKLGLNAITMKEEDGGLGLGYEIFSKVLEEIAKSSVSYAVTLSVSAMTQAILAQFGNQRQRETYLPSLISGEEIGAFALSEAGAGSDPASLTTQAKKVEGGYILNGTKMWITSGGIAKTYIVMARTGKEGAKGISAFILRDGTKGFYYGKAENKMGWNVSPTRELIFEDCFIPEENLLKEEGLGFKIAMAALDRGRITIGSIGVGLAQRALDEALSYSLERKQFGQAIFDFQGLQFMMADMATEIEASRLLVSQAARLFDQGSPNIKLASMAKMKATDTAMKVSTDAVQVLGGVGYTKEFPVERYMRDAKVLQIVEGTNQIQKVIIARSLKKEML